MICACVCVLVYVGGRVYTGVGECGAVILCIQKQQSNEHNSDTVSSVASRSQEDTVSLAGYCLDAAPTFSFRRLPLSLAVWALSLALSSLLPPLPPFPIPPLPFHRCPTPQRSQFYCFPHFFIT